MRVRDANTLSAGLIWVLFRYADGSEFCFQTTLNEDILRAHGIVLEEGCLVRLDKKYLENGAMVYRQFNYDGVSISMWDKLTYTDSMSASLHKFL